MRKMLDSSKTVCRILLSSRAEATSRPKGFSTTTRAFCAAPELPSWVTTGANMLGGIAR